MSMAQDSTYTKRVLIVTAVAAERDAVLRGLRGAEGFEVIAAGVGTAAAAAGTAAALAAAPFDLVVSAGIGGGFHGRAAIGSLVVASEIVAADLGAETQEGFLSLDKLGFGSNRIAVDMALTKHVVKTLEASGVEVHEGPVLTMSTVTGSAETAIGLASRIPGASAEAMEGFGVATAAQQRGLPVIEIRAISNAVGPRDRNAWRIGDALQTLETASSLLPEVLR